MATSNSTGVAPKPLPLQLPAGDAIGRGLEFIAANIGADGAWPSSKHGDRELASPGEPEAVPFVAALGALSLGACPGARAAGLRERTREYLTERIEAPGVWRYWPGLPPDLDDTSLCSLVVGSHLWMLLGRTLPVILSRRDEQGRFRTWLAAQPTAESSWDDVDSVVNANVVAWLGATEDTRRARSWREGLVREGREDGTSWYYPDTLDLHAAMARAHDLAAPAFEAVGERLIERILSRRRADGCYGDAHATALAVTALDQLGRPPAEDAVARLIAAQRTDGGWPSGIVWQGPTPPSPPYVFFASDALATARCAEALARYLAAVS